MSKKGITLIEILVLFLLLFLGVTGALIGGRWFGVLGYPLGAISLIACFYLVVLICSLIEHLAVGGIPRIPRCRRGAGAPGARIRAVLRARPRPGGSR